jgi:protein SCO1/2
MTHRSRTSPALSLIAALAVMFAAALPCSAQVIKSSLPQLEGVGVMDRRGTQVPFDLVFTDSDGRKITSKQLFDGRRPVMLVMAYYTCPLLCSLVLDHVKESINQLSWTAGEDYRIVTISFDHRNTPEQAAAKKTLYLLGYEPDNANKADLKPDAWQFLCADAENAQAISKAVGFHYRYLPENGEFSHPSAIFFLTPTGTVSGFIENLQYDPKDVKLALTQAGEGKTGTLFDRIVMSCFMYDPKQGTYVLQAMQVMKIGGIVTALTLGTFIGTMFLIHNRRRPQLSCPAPTPTSIASTPTLASICSLNSPPTGTLAASQE